MIVTQFIMQKMTPMAPGMDPQQAKMMQFMPLMFGFFFYTDANEQLGMLVDPKTGKEQKK